jgi:regulator of sirC expression with transglutaminase-like and TPR domain
MSISQINALITLIEDPDESVFQYVKSEIEAYGESIMPVLGQYRDTHNYGELFSRRIDDLISDIHLSSLERSLEMWVQDSQRNLLDAVLIINQFQYPTLDIEGIRREIGRIRQDIWLELNDNLTALEIVNVINHILFKVHGFAGNRQNFTDPRNSFLSDVLLTKKGNPLTLSMLYQIMAVSLDIPIYGVNLPNHFILAYLDEHALPAEADSPNGTGVLFYINPFSNGNVIHRDEIDEFISHLNLPAKAAYYQPCTDPDMVARMLNNLIYSYSQMNDHRKAEDIKRLLSSIRRS